MAEVTLAAAAATADQAPWWATLVAALLGGLIGSAITAAVAITTARAEREHDRQMRKEERDAQGVGDQRAERRDAYAQLLCASALLMNTADAFRQTMAVRSGVSEGIDLATGARKPVDPLELNDRLRRDIEPLFGAWSKVWAIGSQAAITQANRLVELGGTVLGTATTRGAARTGLSALLLGEKWTTEQTEQWQASLRTFAVARKEFAELARQELGSEVAELITRAADPRT